VAAVAGVSFLAALIGVNPFVHSWLLGFYSPVRRAWEFAVGALLVLVPVPTRFSRAAVALGAAGLVASLWTIDAATPFPGVWTLLPVGATALLLLGGSPVSRLLATKPLVKVGDWSYSIYLWHWPLIVFAAALWPESPHARLLAAGLSFAPALCSYVYVERPIRALQLTSRVRVAVLVGAVLVTPVVVDGALATTVPGVWTPGYDARERGASYPGSIGQDFLYRYLRAHYRPCTPSTLRASAPTWNGTIRCFQSHHGPLDLAVIGDSHAEHLFVGLAEAEPRLNVGYYITPYYLRPTMQAPQFARIVRTVAESARTRVVVVNALWTARAIDEANLRPTLAALAAARKHVFVTDDVPMFPFDAFACKYRRALFMHTECGIPRPSFDSTYADYYPGIAAAVRDVPGAHLIRTAHAFCDRVVCSMVRHGTLLYRDDNHLNIAGSRYVAGLMLADRAFAAALQLPDTSSAR
jgi:SGNH domain-containing protein